jgi:hypothetical protein
MLIGSSSAWPLTVLTAVRFSAISMMLSAISYPIELLRINCFLSCEKS